MRVAHVARAVRAATARRSRRRPPINTVDATTLKRNSRTWTIGAAATGCGVPCRTDRL